MSCATVGAVVIGLEDPYEQDCELKCYFTTAWWMGTNAC